MSQYQLSKKLISIRSNDDIFMYHSLYNNPRIINDDINDFLNIFSTPIGLEQIEDFDNEDTKEVFNEFYNLGFIEKIDDTSFQEKILKKQNEYIKEIQSKKTLNRLDLAISDACNLGCSHCMHFKNNSIEKRTSPTLNMSIENAKDSIDKFVELVTSVDNNKVMVHFGNGEPLVNWKTLKFCMEYCETINHVDFTYVVNTNLTLLTKEIALTLKKYNCKISTSLDGIGKGNDNVRHGLKGEGTFEIIVKSIQLLKEIDFPLTGFGITALKNNFDYINNDIVDFAKEMNIKEITMDFDLVDIIDISIEESIAKVLSLKKYAFENGIIFSGNWADVYKNIFLNSWLYAPYAYCHALDGSSVEFAVNGNLKMCGYSNTIIGFKDNINDLFLDKSDYITLIEQHLAGNNTDMCKECEIEGACSGECLVTCEASQSNKKVMNIKCDFTKKITNALIREYLEKHI
jgi:radical SAM protein with 4Fe4S-binding SPASM domain